MPYPKITCDLNILLDNVNRLADLLHKEGRTFAAVTKCFTADPHIVDMLNRSRCDWLADSRVENLKSMQTDKPRFLIRIAQPWELDEAVRCADYSFQSEPSTIAQLGAAAARAGKTHGVVLALDLGDLREGCYFKDREDMLAAARAVLAQPALELAGVGCNLGCFGGVKTTPENMAELCACADFLRRETGAAIPLISGMSSCAQTMLLNGTMPAAVNHARIGEAWLVGWDSVFGCPVPGMRNDAFTLSAQLVEIKNKDSKPVGEIGGDSFGVVIERPDLGPMRRGIVAFGAQDMDRDKLEPKDARIHILGGSGDHTLLNLNEAPDYRVGDIVSFRMDYSAVLRGFTSRYVEREFVALL